MKKQVTVIIPTRNRRNLLDKCIHSITKSNFNSEKIEIVVVDDGFDNSFEMIMDYKERFEGVLKYFHIQKMTNPAVARNYGMRKTNNEVILFCDSDCLVHPDWIKKHYTELQKNQVDATIGKFHMKQNRKNKWGAFESIIDKKRVQKYVIEPKSVQILDMRNAGIKKDVFEKMGGFDPLLISNEGIELGHRLNRNNMNIKFLSEAITYHAYPTTLLGNLRRKFWHGIGAGQVIEKYRKVRLFGTNKKESLKMYTTAFQSFLLRIKKILKQKTLLTSESKRPTSILYDFLQTFLYKLGIFFGKNCFKQTPSC